MATAVLDFEINQLPAEITGLDRYQHALILLRFRRCPMGRVTLPVIKGRIEGTDLRSAAINACDSALPDAWLRDFLGWSEMDPLATLPTATVAVCTRNRPDDLHRCLDALTQLPDLGQEILVVDSCSTGDVTRQVVDQFPTVRYIREDRPGLNIARNRALREARHSIVAFCDDDAVPDPGWLNGLLRNFADPLVLCVTGLTMPLELETEAQEWFERYSPFSRGFQRRVYDRRSCHPLAAGRVGAGANMALRRTVLEAVGPFDEALDAGTPTQSGGDTEIFSRILAQGYRIVYDPIALSWHRHRRTWEELRQTLYGYGVGTYAYWTRKLLLEHEMGVFWVAYLWFRHDQFPALVRTLLRRPESVPFDLLMAEIQGCFAGPRAYLRSRSTTQA
ncbi:MAG: glycosyltransferase [Caldilineaceae bacterium]|nr:glycosyltransferase [Caldilineaceae bacterium]